MRYFVTIAGSTVEVDLSGPHPLVDGGRVDAELITLPGTETRSLRVGGESHTTVVRPGAKRGQWKVAVNGRFLDAEVLDERTRTIREMTGTAEVATARVIAAPMPGLVVRINVQPGDTVRAGQGLIAVEAMKMENELKAPADGIVSRIEVTVGQTVEKGVTLVILE
mgnify:CR=1 FL=1